MSYLTSSWSYVSRWLGVAQYFPLWATREDKAEVSLSTYPGETSLSPAAPLPVSVELFTFLSQKPEWGQVRQSHSFIIQSITSKWRSNQVPEPVDPDWICGCGPARLRKPSIQIAKGKNVGGASGPHPGSCGGSSLILSIVQRPTSLSPFTWILSYWEAIHTAIPTEELEREDFFQMPKSY